MKIEKETIRKIAHLARLDFEEKDEETIVNDLNKIIGWVDKLSELNTDNVEPLTHMSYEINIMREDEAKVTLKHEEALANAPKKDSDYFRVPKFLN